MMRYEMPEQLDYKVKHRKADQPKRDRIDILNIALFILLVLVVVLFVFGRD